MGDNIENTVKLDKSILGYISKGSGYRGQATYLAPTLFICLLNRNTNCCYEQMVVGEIFKSLIPSSLEFLFYRRVGSPQMRRDNMFCNAGHIVVKVITDLGTK